MHKTDKLLEACDLSKHALAKNLGISTRTVYTWGDNPPTYALAYLEVYAELHKAKKAKQWLGEWMNHEDN